MRFKLGAGLVLSMAAVLLSFNLFAADSSYYNQRGLDELRAGSPEKAAEFFTRAVESDPLKKHYHNNLAAAYIRLGEYSRAELSLKNSLKLDGSYAKALSNMSVVLFHLGRYRESYRYYLKSKSADRDYTEKRFEPGRVSSAVNKLSSEKPGDRDLRRIKNMVDDRAGGK